MIKNHINLIIIETETHILTRVVENDKNRKQKIRKTTLLSLFSKRNLVSVMGLFKKKQKNKNKPDQCMLMMLSCMSNSFHHR